VTLAKHTYSEDSKANNSKSAIRTRPSQAQPTLLANFSIDFSFHFEIISTYTGILDSIAERFTRLAFLCRVIILLHYAFFCASEETPIQSYGARKLDWTWLARCTSASGH
jgi:hypothetical protein